jgi:DNA-binding transcriptional LysR family regulator
LDGEPFVGLKPSYGLRRITDELCRSAGFTPVLAFEGEEVDTLRGLVTAGLGLAVLPAAERPLPGGAVELSLSPRATREIALVWAAGRALAPAARIFRDFATARTEAPQVTRCVARGPPRATHGVRTLESS